MGVRELVNSERKRVSEFANSKANGQQKCYLKNGRKQIILKLTKTKVSKVSDIPFEKLNIKKGGLVYYTTDKEGRNHYCFGVDKTYLDITVLAGGFKKKDKHILKTCDREGREESQNVFPEFSVRQLMDCYCAYNNELLIIFVYVDINMNDVCNKFLKQIKEKKKKGIRVEVSQLIFLTKEQFSNELYGRKSLLWKRDRDFFTNTRNPICSYL